MSISYSNPSTRRRKRLAFGSSAALAIMAIPVIIGGQASAGFAALPLTAKVVVDNREYDGSTDASINSCVLEGVTDGDIVFCDYSSATATFASPDVGMNISVNVINLDLTGANEADYVISTTDVTPADIGPVTLTVDPDGLSANYGDAKPSYTYNLTGFVGGDDETSLSSQPVCDSDYDQFDPVGNYEIKCLSGTATNYLFDISATDILAVGTATLTVDPDGLSANYGDAEPSYTYNLSGFVGGDDETSLSSQPVCDSDYDQFDPVGNYEIKCLSGTATNYDFDISATDILAVGTATLDVDPSDLTISYGAPEPLFDFNVNGFLGVDSEVNINGYSGPTCGSDYDAGDPVGDYPITCTGGIAANYEFTYSPATLTVTPFTLGDGEVVYSGQTSAYTKSTSTTSAQVTLSASITADFDGDPATSASCIPGGPSVSDATVTFRDQITGRIFAKDVPIAQVGGNCEEGIATTFATLSTGQNGTEAYVIEVIVGGSFSGANTTQTLDTTTVLVALPMVIGTFQSYGELPFKTSSSLIELGTEGTLTGSMNGNPATTTYRFIPGTRKVTPKGQAVIVIPAADGGFYYIKTNSITSVVTGATATTVFAKASITLVGGACDPSCGIDGNVSLRLDITNGGSIIGYTVQSSKNSSLYYSNDWYKDGRVWKTRPQTLS